MRHLLCFVFVIGACSSAFTMAQELNDYVPLQQRRVLEHWLIQNPTLRVATDADCQCPENINEIRKGSGGVWKENPTYHPYYASGDFNDDGEIDFSVVVIDNAKKQYVVIFNGPLLPGNKPAYQSASHAGALFYGPPRPKPYRLIVGNFNSEGGLFVPKGKSYVYDGGN